MTLQRRRWWNTFVFSWPGLMGGGTRGLEIERATWKAAKRRTPFLNPFSLFRYGGSRLEAPISPSRTHARSLNGAPFVGVGSPPFLPARAHFLSPFFFFFLAAGKAPTFPSGESASVGPFSLPPSLFLIPVAPGARRERKRKGEKRSIVSVAGG